ncbi:MAG: hypothetical protein ACHQTE_00055 [Candidatus Saccharimonadales bacterium]
MKDNIITSLKLVLADRLITVLLAIFVLSCVAYCIYVGVSLHPNDLQIAVHYTAFGSTNFYRQKWYYLLSFIAFGIILAVVHSTLTVKLYVQQRRQIALVFIWLSLFMVIIAWLLTQSILKVASF